MKNGLTSNLFNQACTRLAVNSEPLPERNGPAHPAHRTAQSTLPAHPDGAGDLPAEVIDGIMQQKEPFAIFYIPGELKFLYPDIDQ